MGGIVCAIINPFISFETGPTTHRRREHAETEATPLTKPSHRPRRGTSSPQSRAGGDDPTELEDEKHEGL